MAASVGFQLTLVTRDGRVTAAQGLRREAGPRDDLRFKGSDPHIHPQEAFLAKADEKFIATLGEPQVMTTDVVH